MKTVFIFIIILIVASLAFSFFFSEKDDNFKEEMIETETETEIETEAEEKSQLANPASIYCEENEGTIEIINFENGENGICLFNDNSSCWEWDFFNKNCDKGQLKIEILESGEGLLADNGNKLTVHYLGTFENGEKFDSSFDINMPFNFILGEGQVIAGWDQGLLGMKKGEKRKLFIDANLAYGEIGAGQIIPGNTNLIFEVELLEIE